MKRPENVWTQEEEASVPGYFIIQTILNAYDYEALMRLRVHEQEAAKQNTTILASALYLLPNPIKSIYPKYQTFQIFVQSNPFKLLYIPFYY